MNVEHHISARSSAMPFHPCICPKSAFYPIIFRDAFKAQRSLQHPFSVFEYSQENVIALNFTGVMPSGLKSLNFTTSQPTHVSLSTLINLSFVVLRDETFSFRQSPFLPSNSPTSAFSGNLSTGRHSSCSILQLMYFRRIHGCVEFLLILKQEEQQSLL